MNAITAFQEIKHDNKILAIIPKRIAGELTEVSDYLIKEEEFRANHPEIVFDGAFGGNRNIALAICHALGENAIFFDDDTSPINDPVKQHEELLKTNDAVFGKYVHHAAGTLSCLLKLVQEYNNPQPNEKQIKNYSSNIPKETDSPLPGIVGGNTSINLEVIPNQCFYPTKYRVEDALYYGLSQHYGFTCLESNEVIVKHEKTGAIGALARALENEVAGSSIAYCISQLIQKQLPPEKAIELKKQCFDSAWDYYSIDYAKKKLPETKYTKTIHDIELNNLILSDEEFLKEVNKFFNSQQQWTQTLQSVHAEEFEC